MKAILLFICCLIGLSAYGQISWKVAVVEDETGSLKQYRYTLESVSYTSSKGEWTVEVPKVYTRKPFYSGSTKIDVNKSTQPPVFLFDQPFSNTAIVVLPFTVGLMVLNAKTGAQIKWIAYKLDGNYLRPSLQNGYWFDDGKYTITCGKETYQSDLVYDASFLTKFKKYVLHFNGQQLFVLNAKNGKLLGKGAIENRSAKKARVYATSSWKNLIVNWDGIIYR